MVEASPSPRSLYVIHEHSHCLARGIAERGVNEQPVRHADEKFGHQRSTREMSVAIALPFCPDDPGTNVRWSASSCQGKRGHAKSESFDSDPIQHSLHVLSHSGPNELRHSGAIGHHGSNCQVICHSLVAVPCKHLCKHKVVSTKHHRYHAASSIFAALHSAWCLERLQRAQRLCPTITRQFGRLWPYRWKLAEKG